MRRVEFQCASCSDKANRKGVAVDHIEAVINPTTGFTDFDTYVKRLFVKANQLQVLCKACHNAKSKAENAIRRKIKKEKENKV